MSQSLVDLTSEVDPAPRSAAHDADDQSRLAVALGPGWQAAEILTSIDPDQLGASGRLSFLKACEQLTAWSSSLAGLVLVAHVGRVELVDESTSTHTDVAALQQSAAREEVQAELCLSEPVTRARIRVARETTGRLSATGAALRAGKISFLHALTICDATTGLDDDQAVAVEASALAKGVGRPLAVLRRACRVARDAIAPEAVLKRHQAARANRGPTRWAETDGMACLQVRATALDVTTIWNTLTRLAGPTRAGDPRTLDNRRVDALVDLCRAATGATERDPGGRPRRPPVEAQIVVDLPTLLGLADHPGVLAGYGPVPADLAREWAGTAETIRRLVTDPVTGHLLDYGPRIRTAPARLRDYVVARDQTCTFPGCRIPATQADLDHDPPWEPDGSGGSTSAAHLGALCRHHHRLKTHTGWALQRAPDGSTTWSSPAGRSYTVSPTHPLDPD